MKPIITILITLLILLQYEVWFAPRGIVAAYRLHHNIAKQAMVNKQLKKRNKILMADTQDLKEGNEAIEERARNDLGMIKPGEVFYQVVN